MNFHWHRRIVHLHHPFNISRSRDSRPEKEILYVTCEHEGQMGWGEVAPDRYYGQTLESAERALAQLSQLPVTDPYDMENVFDWLWRRMPDQSATIAAIDSALHDLVGKLLGVPVWKLLGLDAGKVPPTSFTIGLDELPVMVQKVREAGDYPILKVKVGTDRDEAILGTIRELAPDKPLRVDANCGWDSATVVEQCRRLVRFDLEFIEQPTPAGDHDALKDLRGLGIAPIIADESCVGFEDVLRCAGHFDGINIKLCKCGGLRQGLKMIHVARAAGLKVMLGCMVESSVGIAAAAQLAPLADWIDLDGHLLLADDPFEGIGGAAGRLTLNARPGLGVAPIGDE